METLTRGIRGYASILRLLMGSNATTAQIASVMTFGKNEKSNRYAINRLLRRLQPMGIVHVAEWSRGIGCPPCEVWSFGPGENAAAPARYDGLPRVRLVPSDLKMRIETFTFGQIMLALVDGHSVIDLADLVGGALVALYPFIRHAHAIGLVHICEWHRQPSSNPRPVYRLGAAPDKPRPKALPKSETDRRYRERREARESAQAICRMISAPLAQQSDSR